MQGSSEEAPQPPSSPALGTGAEVAHTLGGWRERLCARAARLRSWPPCSGPAPPVFGLISALLHRAGKRQEGDRNGETQGSGIPSPEPFKADNLCFTKGLIRKHTNPQRPNKGVGRIPRSQERRGGAEGQRPGAGPQGRLAMSLSGGGPAGLEPPSLALPSNIMTSLSTAERFPSIMLTKSR